MEKEINYTVRKNIRSRALRLSIRTDGQVVVTKPYFVNNYFVKKFVLANKAWIEKHCRKNILLKLKLEKRKVSYKADKEKAREYICKKVNDVSKKLGVEYGRVSIKNQRTVWGSCSKRGNLNFSFRLLHIPEELSDYVIAHELCHLKELNHSKRFWSLVEKIIPDYKNRQKELRRIK